jgi:hypothetical protein
LGGAGGAGGGGAGGDATPPPGTNGAAGTALTGGGGGGAVAAVENSGAGGSGVVILRVPDTVTATFSNGVTHGNNSPDFNNGNPITSVSGYKIYVVSATSNTSQTVTFS